MPTPRMIFPSAADEGAAAAVRVPSFPAGNRRRMKIENYVFFSVSYRYICRHPKQNLAMALYRLESDRTQIGIDLDTKTRDNDLRHPDYARHAQIMRLVYVQSLLSGQSILQTIPSLADHFPQLDPFNPEHQACVCCIWDAAFDLHRPPHMRIGRTDCAYFFTERASCEYYRNYSGMSGTAMRSANPRNVRLFYRGHALARRHRRAYGHGP